MDGKTIIKMLLIIQKNGSITELIKDGFTYGQIANMTTDLVKIGYIEEKEETLRVSEEGQNWLDSNFKENKLVGSEKWIVPENKSRIDKLKENEVYLPNRNELHF